MSFANRRRVPSLFLLLLVSAFAGPAQAQFQFQPATSLISPSVGGDQGPSLSSDNRTLYFTSSPRPGGRGSFDMWMATRPTPVGLFGTAVNMGPILNSPVIDAYARESLDGLSLVFQSDRPGGPLDSMDLWMSNRATIADSWGTPLKLTAVNSTSGDYTPDISADGLTLLFSSERGGFGGPDLYMATRPNTSVPFGAAVNLGSTLNTSALEYYPSLSTDGLALFFSSDRAGGFGDADLWVSTRASSADSWRTPVNLGPNVNGPFWDTGVDIAWDGSSIVFNSTRDGGVYHLYQAAVIPEPSTLALFACGLLLVGLAVRRRSCSE